MGANSTLRNFNLTSRKSPDEILLYGISCGLKDGSNVQSKQLEIRFLDENGFSLRKVNPNCLESSVNSSFKIFEVPIKDLYNTEVLEKPWGSLNTRTDECLANPNSQDFELWKKDFKNYAIEQGITQKTVNLLIDAVSYTHLTLPTNREV